MLLDMLLALNLAFSILLLLVTLSAKRPMDVAVFPSLLLLTTLFRLSLNVATTRLILLNGDAGKIVSTFGDFIVGGQLIVGIVIFLILVVIQFIVITKGAGRISEVNARFTLDALPGKQMAIDAELAAQSIDQHEARRQRRELAREAEFFGAMDGAGKYVRGDSIAGLLITLVNLAGGVIIGTTNGLSLGEAVQHFSVLTIGDGLITQIPALIIATTAGLLVTKASSESHLGKEVHSQMFSKRRPLILGGVVLLVLAMTPGLPKIPFIALALTLFYLASRMKSDAQQATQEKEAKESKQPVPPPDDGLEQFVRTDRICIEIGSSLIPFVERQDGQSLKDRITSLRNELTRKFGLWVPKVRIRDMFSLGKGEYRIHIAGRCVASGDIAVDEFLAIDSGTSQMQLVGQETKDPAFGLKAYWISASQKRRAEFGGYTVVDALTVLTTHLREMIRKHAHELLGREDLQKMLEKVRENSPTIVDELKPDVVRPAVLRKVLVHLLEERVPINNLEMILESIVQHGSQVKDPETLAEHVRADIGPVLCEPFRSESGQLRVLILDPRLETRLLSLIHEGRLSMPAGPLERIVAALRKHWESSVVQEQPVALLIDGRLRRPLRMALRRALNELSILSYLEIPTESMIDPVSLISAEEIFPPDMSQTPSPVAAVDPQPSARTHPQAA
jgi:flagellar biosynthesis protein FlhA